MSKGKAVASTQTHSPCALENEYTSNCIDGLGDSIERSASPEEGRA